MHWKQPGIPLKKVLLVIWFIPILAAMLAVAPHLGSHSGASDATAIAQSAVRQSPTILILPTTTTNITTPIIEVSTPPSLVTPSLGLEDYMNLSSTPKVSSATLKIYLDGQALGNNPRAFSKVGDCNSLDPYFLSYFDLDRSAYDLGSYAFLQPAIEQFSGSFKRISLAVGDGFNTSAVLSPSRADSNECKSNESPLVCEYRIHKPSYAIISIGTDDYLTAANFETNMRKIIDTTINLGIVPILVTTMDDANQLHYNTIITKLAYEYAIPFDDLGSALQPLLQHGMDDNIHPSGAADAFVFSPYNLNQYGWPVRNLTVLEALSSTWRGVTQP